jgi:hypothetical protein
MPLTDYQYYDNGGNSPENANWGSYQYLSLADVVNNFMLMSVGDDKLLNNVKRHEVLFFAKEAVKEFNYDAAKEVKALEYIVQSDLKMILPHDYVNIVRLSYESNGVLYPMYENQKAITATAYVQDNSGNLTFDINGNVITGQSELDIRRLDQTLYSGSGAYNNCYGWCYNDNWYFGFAMGGRYGLDTSTATSNPTFTINKRSGVIDFASNISGQRVVLEYISDGMENGDDSSIDIHKFAEKWIHAYIRWCLLDNKIMIQEYIVRRAKDKESSLRRNLKIRLSNNHSSELLMMFRGKDKTIK